ncbi:MAG: T9SS type A sorting domain-containing protein [Saprospiraceae bacterium]|nr:T9SS type A sorting domain-containing protein [Saprospiraceae bacterium]
MRIASPSPNYTDSKIKMDIVQVLFHKNSVAWAKTNQDSWSSEYTTYVENSSLVNYKYNSIHVFLPGESSEGDGIAFGQGYKSYNVCQGAPYRHPNEPYNLAALIRHEVCHNLGLDHTWSGSDGCDDTPTNCNCWNIGMPCTSACPCGPSALNCDTPGEVSNNIMDYNADKNAITQCQLHRMHANLMSSSGNYRIVTSTPVKKTPTISGPSCLTSVSSYVMTNHEFGTTASWSVSPTSAVTVASGCGNVAVLTPKPGASGTATITYTMTYGKHGSKSGTYTFTVNPDITGTVTSGGSTYPFYGGGNFVDGTSVSAAIQAPGATSFTWTKTGGSGSWSTYNSGKNLSLTLSTGGDISFNITTTNSTCGTLSTSCYFVHIGGYYSFYPNPTNGDLFVEVLEDEIEIDVPDGEGKIKKEKIKFGMEKLSLYDKSGNLLKEIKVSNGSKKATLSLSGLTPDVYIAKIKDGNRTIESKIIKN